MPIWALQIILAVIPLIGKLIEKCVPSHIHKKREFETKKKIMIGLENFKINKMTTLEELARMKNGTQG